MRSLHRSRFVNSLVCSLVLALGAACGAPPPPAGNGSTDGTSPANANSAGPSTPQQTGGDPAGASRKDLTVLAVGDVNLGRILGKRILSGQKDLPFRNVRNEVSGADIAFANLESQISDQKGQTEGSSNYVFTGPPQGADELANAGFDVDRRRKRLRWIFIAIEIGRNAAASMNTPCDPIGFYPPTCFGAVFDQACRRIDFGRDPSNVADLHPLYDG